MDQPPREDPRGVEPSQVQNGESALVRAVVEFAPSVASEVPKAPIERTVEEGKRRDEDQQTAAGPQHPEGFPQCPDIVLDVFQNIDEYQCVERPGRSRATEAPEITFVNVDSGERSARLSERRDQRRRGLHGMKPSREPGDLSGVGANARTDFGNLASEIRPEVREDPIPVILENGQGLEVRALVFRRMR